MSVVSKDERPEFSWFETRAMRAPHHEGNEDMQ